MFASVTAVCDCFFGNVMFLQVAMTGHIDMEARDEFRCVCVLRCPD